MPVFIAIFTFVAGYRGLGSQILEIHPVPSWRNRCLSQIDFWQPQANLGIYSNFDLHPSYFNFSIVNRLTARIKSTHCGISAVSAPPCFRY